tara:strand:- start:132 stop:539 length:408 start_codon:yes stop_codon:yes gene_type:complete
MKQFSVIITLTVFAFIAQNAFAHGDHKKKPPSTPSLEEPVDSMYITEEKESDPFKSSEMFSPGDLFMPGEIEPEKNDLMNMEGSHNEKDDHSMPKVESAKHKAIETSSKGYATALGITVFAGLIFAGLTFIRPGE